MLLKTVRNPTPRPSPDPCIAFARSQRHHSIYMLNGKQEVRIILTPAGLASCDLANVRYQLPVL